MIIENILIEINDKDLLFENPIKILLNHKLNKLIGFAKFTVKEDGLFADLNLNDNMIKRFKMKGFYFPSIGFSIKSGEDKKTGKIFYMALCDSENEDERIKAIEI